jgi:threonylcarbamoyladenosine tRNA methylthiotransferase CDKAL1
MTSEDTGTYGRDIGSSLPELLWKVVELLPEGTMLRLGMTNPPYILEHIEACCIAWLCLCADAPQEIARIMQHPRVYAFLHIPVQAASDAVLGAMRREYICDDFCRVVDVLRERVPGVTIATDIICGFPGPFACLALSISPFFQARRLRTSKRRLISSTNTGSPSYSSTRHACQLSFARTY